ncbi:MAG: type I methionyl aminopeptidase [Propionibacteriaceae bacterium]|jgi:methionyl aminopeptidase|nr:type I methionyl aminopeptidase [Propionibacteriaceae bacterium]
MAADGIELKTADQIRAMRRAGLVVARALEAMAAAAQPGATTADLDVVARATLEAAGAQSSFLGYSPGWGMPPYPAVVCVSVNEVVVHGIPSDRVLCEGDLVSIDFGASLDGWHGDAAVTVEVGSAAPAARALSEATRQALWAGLGAARIGGRVGDVSAAVERRARQLGRFGVVRDYTGHGIGSAMHQDPDVPNYGRPRRGPVLVEGLCLAVEPMLTAGSPRTASLEDDWTVVTVDGSWAAHWEHTVALTAKGLWVLTAPDGGEAELTARGLPFGPLDD